MCVEKIQLGLFFILVLLLPSQLGWHFWPDWSVIQGVRVDYFSPTIHLTDIVVATIFFFEIIKKKKLNLKSVLQVKTWGVASFISLFVFLNIYLSVSPAVTVYKWVKFFEMGVLGWWIFKNKSLRGYSHILTPLLGATIMFTSILVVWQFVNQGSIGGWWYFFGERTFSPVTPGIANTFFAGQLVLRPYGTFPHPNVVAGFLALAVLVFHAAFMRKKCVKSKNSFVLSALWCLVFVIAQTAIFLSLSRSAIIAYLISLGTLLFFRFNRRKRLTPLVLLALICALTVGPRIFYVKYEWEPVVTRISFFAASWASFMNALVVGKGLGTSPLLGGLENISYALRYQPPHSIFLVILVETGLAGLIAFLVGIYKVLDKAVLNNKDSRPLFGAMFMFVFITGLTDHYWVTLQQGILSTIVLAGIAMSITRR